MTSTNYAISSPHTCCQHCSKDSHVPHSEGCPPDTEEWEKEFERRSDSNNYEEVEPDDYGLVEPNDSFFGNIPWPESKYEIDSDKIKPFIRSLLTSRDTYWKERVDAEIADAVDLTKREIKHRVERYFKDAYLALKQQGGVPIHLEEIQEIIDDSTPPGVYLRN